MVQYKCLPVAFLKFEKKVLYFFVYPNVLTDNDFVAAKKRLRVSKHHFDINVT